MGFHKLRNNFGQRRRKYPESFKCMKRFRQTYSSGAPWEQVVGYSRAVRVGRQVEVAGTTAVEDGEVMFPGNAYFQTKVILDIVRDALESAGARLEDVVRTRIFTTDMTMWQDIGRAHGEFFSAIKPASTMVEVSRLIHDDLVVEIEVTAVIPPQEGDLW